MGFLDYWPNVMEIPQSSIDFSLIGKWCWAFFIYITLNEQLNKHNWWWFETPRPPMWRNFKLHKLFESLTTIKTKTTTTTNVWFLKAHVVFPVKYLSLKNANWRDFLICLRKPRISGLKAVNTTAWYILLVRRNGRHSVLGHWPACRSVVRQLVQAEKKKAADETWKLNGQ